MTWSDDTAEVDPVIDRIRQSVRELDAIADKPLTEHAHAYESVHSRLQGELAEIDGGTSSS